MRRALASLLLTLAMLLLGAGAARSETPGQINSVERVPPARIFEGIPADDAQFGTAVAILYRKNDGQRHICTGVVVAPKKVLTAGHCGCGKENTYWIHVREDVRIPQDGNSTSVIGPPILFDSSICGTGRLAAGNDLALLHLEDEVRFAGKKPSYSFLSQTFDLRERLRRGSRVRAVGYGYTESHTIGVRLQADIPVWSAVCEERELAEICSPFLEMVLSASAGSRGISDTCGGDSGGPVFLIEGGGMELIAITSRGAPGMHADPSLGCGGGGIYTLLGRKKVQDWLAANGVVIKDDMP